MAIQAIPPATQNRTNDAAAKVVKNNTTNAASERAGTDSAIGEATVFEKSAQPLSAVQTYTKDTAKLDEINKAVEEKLGSLRSAVEKLISMQQVKSGEAAGLSYDQIMSKYDGKLKEFFSNLKVDDETRSKAQQDIAADGFWGVKQTSERAIEFAKALSGGDPSKIALLRTAIEDGYKAAEKSWGGELPELCKQTQEATLKGLDEWGASQAAQVTGAAQAETSGQATAAALAKNK
ncbi:hypothetical protein [Azotosporobacter soli]|uniref:hypothetical protein n=1 Tax=Azotosporobacter soli TaxID=3055040 RepID=UPI0031FE626A